MKPIRQATSVQRARLLTTGPGAVLVSEHTTVEPTDIIARNATDSVRAGLRGQVLSIIPQYGAIISGIATEVAGRVGFGGDAQGTLVFARLPAAPEWHGALLIVTSPLTRELALAARAAGVLGIFAASAAPAVIAELTGVTCPALVDGAALSREQWSLPIVLAHGFGAWELRPELTQVLGALAGQTGLLAAYTAIRRGQRPALIVPVVSSAVSLAEERHSLGPGTLVWVIAGQHTGGAGRVVRILGTRPTLPSGARVRAARVLLDNAYEVTVPLAHLLPVG